MTERTFSKVDVLHAIRSIPQERVHEFAVGGHYGVGWIGGSVCRPIVLSLA